MGAPTHAIIDSHGEVVALAHCANDEEAQRWYAGETPRGPHPFRLVALTSVDVCHPRVGDILPKEGT